MTGLTLLEGWMMEPYSALNSIELVLFFFLFFLQTLFEVATRILEAVVGGC